MPNFVPPLFPTPIERKGHLLDACIPCWPQKIPGWWVWFYYICPVGWTLKGVISSQLGDLEDQIVGPGFKGTIKHYLDEHLGFSSGAVTSSIAALLAFNVLFFGVFAASVKVLNFQKR